MQDEEGNVPIKLASDKWHKVGASILLKVGSGESESARAHRGWMQKPRVRRHSHCWYGGGTVDRCTASGIGLHLPAPNPVELLIAMVGFLS